MNTNPVLNSLRNASSLLRDADRELLRPEEDSVILCACQSTKNAVKGFLKTFLAENQVDNSSNSLEKLLEECRRLEPAFNNIQLNCFDCKTEEATDCYCLDINTVSKCFTEAKSVEEFVLAGLKISREDLYHS
jgi:hypothetical protein